MKFTKDERYLSLIFITLISIIITLLIVFVLMDPIKQFFIPSYSDCYQVLKNIDKVDKKILSLFYFYIIFFTIYFILSTILLINLLRRQEIQNIYLTYTILIVFNTLIMASVIYITYEAYISSIYYCNITKDSCVHSYKIINHLDNNQSSILKLEEMKPCLLDVISYIEKAEQSMRIK